MPIPEWVIYIIFIAIIVLPLVYISVSLNSLSELLFARKIQSDIDKVLTNAFYTFSKNKKYDQCYYELEIVRARLSNSSPILRKKYDSTLAIIEHYLMNIERGRVSCDADIETIKEAIFDFVKRYKECNPLDQLKGANYSLLKEILETEVPEKRFELVNQVAIELKSGDETITALLLKNRTSSTLAWVGIILTVVFGVIALF